MEVMSNASRNVSRRRYDFILPSGRFPKLRFHLCEGQNFLPLVERERRLRSFLQMSKMELQVPEPLQSSSA